MRLTQRVFYRDYRFPEVFASLKRAPDEVKERINAIPGVETVETRMVAGVRLDIAGFTDPSIMNAPFYLLLEFNTP